MSTTQRSSGQKIQKIDRSEEPKKETGDENDTILLIELIRKIDGAYDKVGKTSKLTDTQLS